MPPVANTGSVAVHAGPPHLSLPQRWYLDQPALQVQIVFTVLPIGESEPVGQSSQLPSPATLLNFPALQAVQVPPTGPDQPALQVQLVIAAQPAGELEFDGQLIQSLDPAALLYLPAPHSMHVPALGPDHPALQVQSVKAVLCIRHCKCSV